MLLVASNIEFDFTQASSATLHDDPSGHGNNIWPGVDFCIEDADERIWIEVKSWSLARFAPHLRGGQCRSFSCKMKSKPFAAEMRNKFLGTTAFLVWTGAFSVVATRYILIFEPPRSLDAALLLTFTQRLQGPFPKTAPWSQPISIAVLTLAEWNDRFPDYPARMLP